ncbi:hypothetical protein P4V49_27450, partial [Brevibacillus parabrevis]|uniref:hypothetical protein n=1 Tax=Brevibacillus parabrevis TaxID=54914 RepID=UPI002E24DD07|nr:hypothetical protein [Brevibacillus parabrevis]
HAASVRPEPGSNSPIKFVTGSKLANHLMIDSSTLSLFSFQRAITCCESVECSSFFVMASQGQELIYHGHYTRVNRFFKKVFR